MEYTALNIKGYGIVTQTVYTGTDNNDTMLSGMDVGLNKYIGLGGDDIISISGIADVVDAGNGNDRIYASEGLRIPGYELEEYASVIHADGGNDTFDGSGSLWEVYMDSGDDYVIWHNYIDDNQITVHGGDGNDSIFLYGQDYDTTNIVYVFGDEGDDDIGTEGTTDNIHGGDGNDSIFSGSGNDTVDGGAGDDELFCGADDNTIIGGIGNDSLYGDNGNDEYRFALGDGQDTISENHSNAIGDPHDNIHISGVTADNLRFRSDGLSNLIIYYGTDGDNVVVGYQYDNSQLYQIETLSLDDGTVINLTGGLHFVGTSGNDWVEGSPYNDTIDGGAGHDILSDSKGNDVLIGGIGNDNLNGGEGNDEYRFALGDGQDTIADSGGMDTIHISGVTVSDLRFSGSQAERDIYYGTGGDKITVGNYLVDPAYQVENLILDDGTIIDLTGGLHVVGTPGDDYATDAVYGTPFNDILEGLSGDDDLYGGEGNDALIGGVGQDFLSGDEGNDTYRFALGDGQDLIMEIGGTDTINISGVTAEDVRFESDGFSLDIIYGSGGDKITIYGVYGPFADPSVLVETLTLDDGTIFDLTGELAISVSGSNISGTSSSDTISGGDGNDTISGLGGNDRLLGLGGNDSIDGGIGNDTLRGGDGDDSLLGGSGNDTIYGDGGDDYINGGNSADSIRGGDGNDTLYGGSAADLLRGDAGNDIAFGESGADDLRMGAGDDTLNGGTGQDKLYGEAGADTFVFDLDAFNAVDRIKDFSAADGDTIRLDGILSGFDPLTSAITDYARFATGLAGSYLSVDRDGAGASYGFERIAVVEDVPGLDAQTLYDTGVLLVA